MVLLPLLRLGSESLPLLTSIRVHDAGSGSFTDLSDVTNALQIPSLTDISLYIVADPLTLPLRWSQLTGLSLECYSFWTEHGQEGGLDGVGALDVLRRCPNLLRCELRMTKTWNDPDLTSNTSPIILPHIHTLIFRGPLRLLKWIPHLVVPKLRCLQVGEMKTTSHFTSVPIRDPYMRADIDISRVTSSGLLELLQAFPTISHLRLSSDTIDSESMSPDDAFLAHFCPPHNLCPMLTHFTVMTPGAEFSDTAALAFVRARMAMPTPLQQFRVHFDRRMGIDIMPELQSFISNGLQVALEYLPVWKFDARMGPRGSVGFSLQP